MPPPIPVPIRQALWQRARRGQSAPAIASALGLAARTVRHSVFNPVFYAFGIISQSRK